MFMFFFNL